MGEGTSEIRHLRERVLLHDDQLRGMGERIRLLDDMLHELQKIVAPLARAVPRRQADAAGMNDGAVRLNEEAVAPEKGATPVGGAPGSGGVPVVTKAAESRRPPSAKGVRK